MIYEDGQKVIEAFDKLLKGIDSFEILSDS